MNIKGKYHDTHFHLDLNENHEELITQIESKGIYTIAVTNLPVLYKKLSSKINHKYLKVALGFHPELVDPMYIDQLPLMLDCLKTSKYVGEIGLDFTTNFKNKDLQTRVFSQIIDVCRNRKDRILSIHSRGAANEVINIIGKDFNSIVILHWFSGNLTQLKLAVQNNCYFSINYAMASSKKGIRLIKEMPKDRILLESDGPFVKINGELSSPLNISQTVLKVSNILEWNYQETINTFYSNFKQILHASN